MTLVREAVCPWVRLRHGVVRRGRNVVLEAGELMLPWGARVAVVGLNGAGKTTLLMHVADALRSRKGVTIEAQQHDGTMGPVHPSRAIAPQQPRLPPWLRVRDVMRLYGHDPATASRAVPGLRLDELLGARAGSLSAGQAQAVAIGLALAARADLTLLDEPLAPLDFRRRRGLVSLLASRPRDGLLLLSAQSAADVLLLCDWLIVLRQGQYAYKGTVAALLDAAATRTPPGPGGDCEVLERAVLGLLEQ